MLDVVLYVAVNIIRLPHLVVELMTDTRLATEGYVSARIWYRKNQPQLIYQASNAVKVIIQLLKYYDMFRLNILLFKL